MPGGIIGIIGKQRSGKTLIAYKITKEIYSSFTGVERLRVYTNLYCPEDDFIYVNSLDNIPLDLKPKIVLIDEIYNGCDAQDYKKLNKISIFINTIGKQNCLLIFTTIEASMVYNRIRNQMNLAILVKSDLNKIYYKLFHMDSGRDYLFEVVKCPDLFSDVKYDTNFIPLEFDWSMDRWNEKLKLYYLENYDMHM